MYDQASDGGRDSGMYELPTRVRRSIWRDIGAVFAVVAASFAGAVFGAIAVLLWARLSRTPMRELGIKSPRNWLRLLAGAAAFGIALWLALKALVMPLLG